MNTLSTEANLNFKPTPNSIVEAIQISHSYGMVRALESANISVASGEVMGLVGDNGAGKSTLIKVLSGLLLPDSGRIYVNGEQAFFTSPSDSLKAGIQTVYQDLALIDTMTATQNVFVGREELNKNRMLRKLGVVDDASMHTQALSVLGELGVKIPSLKATVRTMSGGQRQCLAIARAVLFGHKIIILDEPTAALGVHESAQVLGVIDRLRSRGLAIILVSHNMQHMFKISDAITVMRLGRTVVRKETKDTTPEEIISYITGVYS